MMNGAFLNQLSQAYTLYSILRSAKTSCDKTAVRHNGPAPNRSRQTCGAKTSRTLEKQPNITLYGTLIYVARHFIHLRIPCSFYSASSSSLLLRGEKALITVTQNS